MEIEKQYFDNSDLEKYFIVDVNVPNEDLISSDTYNETELKNNFIQIEDIGRQLLYISALHVAIIGSGNKVLGAVRYKNNVHQIKDILDKYKILYNKNINEKYDKKTLTIRRLVRMFRLQIQKWIVSTGRPSYLWTKYSEKNEAMIPYCFPGVEHLISEKVQAYYLIDTYKRLDTIHSSKFMTRLERVFISRNILTPGEFRAYAKKLA